MRLKLLALIIIACFGNGFGQPSSTPYVLLVSFDGFRYDYAEKYKAPHFKEIQTKGVHAKALIPSFPSKTFPNHYTIVTGLVPGSHGLVDNQFYDRDRKTVFNLDDRTKVEDSYYYYGTPLWQLAKQHGLKSASYFWVGSEVNDPEKKPDYAFDYDSKISPSEQVKQVLDWLHLPPNDRPHFIALYFSFPDHEGHTYGPSAEETRLAVLRADSVLASLMTGIKETKLPVNLLVVSDHGMKELIRQESTFILLNELINEGDTSVRVVNNGSQAHLYFNSSSKKETVYQRLKEKEGRFVVYRKEEFPSRWKYDGKRTGDLLVVAKPGFYIQKADHFVTDNKTGSRFGVHGYDPEMEKDMRGIFYAIGPNIKSNRELEAFQNIHLYPLMAKILGLPLPAIDGKEKVLRRIYKK